MGLERRGNGVYYYRKRREGGRVVSEYAGGGELAATMARLDRLDRAEREQAQAREREARRALAEQDRAIAELGELVRTLTKAALLAEGAHTHKGQWRKRKKRDG